MVGGGLDAGYERLRQAALDDRAAAFPLGLALLIRGGVTAWRRAVESLTAGGAPTSVTATLAAPTRGVAAELVDALANIALAGVRSSVR